MREGDAGRRESVWEREGGRESALCMPGEEKREEQSESESKDYGGGGGAGEGGELC